jgi:glycosyltransferase involved in cell wall biosynthesis
MSNYDIKVSVIVPTYNREKTISRTIDSVLEQTYKNFELIIVDDASTDNTESIVKNYQKQYKEIIYIKYNQNKGANFARNLGIKKARGEYINFLDSDDEYLVNNLKEKIKFLENINKKNCLVYSKIIIKELNKERIVPYFGIKEKENILNYLFINNGEIITSSLCVKKDVLIKNNIFFDEKLKRHQDWDFLIRLKEYVNFYFLNKPLVIWNKDDSYKTNRDKIDIKNYFNFVNKHEKEFNNNIKALASYQWKLSIKFFMYNKLKEGKFLLRESNKNIYSFKKTFLFYFSFLGYKSVKLLFNIYFKIKNKLIT